MLAIACSLLLVVALCHLWVARSAGGRCFDQLEQVPVRTTALVLGCAPEVDGRPNLFFKHRMQAAASLFHAGRVRALIVSGDNGSRHYDETTAMKEALVAAGVPEPCVYGDYAGFRTLDSVVRADKIFGQKEIVVVSQRFHNERAVFLARRHGIDAVAFNAADVKGARGLKTHLREWLARLRAVLDVTVLGTQPKHLGPPVVIR